jgi:hypothetical protein
MLANKTKLLSLICLLLLTTLLSCQISIAKQINCLPDPKHNPDIYAFNIINNTNQYINLHGHDLDYGKIISSSYYPIEPNNSNKPVTIKIKGGSKYGTNYPIQGYLVFGTEEGPNQKHYDCKFTFNNTKIPDLVILEAKAGGNNSRYPCTVDVNKCTFHFGAPSK